MSSSASGENPPALFSRVPDLWRERLTRLGGIAAQNHLPAAAVGGCVRDLLLGLNPKDWDVVVEGRAAPLVHSAAKVLSARVVEHPRFMTFTLHFQDGTHLDVATARAETYSQSGALPLVRRATLAEDARRRDFTSNALYLSLSPESGSLLDPTGGQADMKARLLRALHDQSFIDDPTRLHRAARYSSRYGWAVEEKTMGFIREAVSEERPRSVSLVRLRHELFRILEEEDPVPALRSTWEWGLWKFWDADWKLTDVLAQRVKSTPRESPPVQRLAAFLSPHPITAEAALKRFSTPMDLRRRVLAFLAQGQPIERA
ncbi:MAG: CCA tRNA nucleotidyltransferase [Elusimicrobia bacterium]|nr:CCA tRNA nucleotidyltransferase [Elusimicrobiota bacterium]